MPKAALPFALDLNARTTGTFLPDLSRRWVVLFFKAKSPIWQFNTAQGTRLGNLTGFSIMVFNWNGCYEKHQKAAKKAGRLCFSSYPITVPFPKSCSGGQRDPVPLPWKRDKVRRSQLFHHRTNKQRFSRHQRLQSGGEVPDRQAESDFRLLS